MTAATAIGISALAEHGEVESEEAQRDSGAQQLEPQHCIGHAVVQPGEPDGLLVDHVVQAVDVQARGGVARMRVETFAGQTPQGALKSSLLRRCGPDGRAAGDLVRDADRQIVVAAQARERAAALRLCDRLSPQVRRADRVCVGHDVRTAVLVSADRE